MNITTTTKYLCPFFVRILCLVHSTPLNLDTSGQAVYGTWGRRCTYFFFILSQESRNNSFNDLPIIYSPGPESWDFLWGKTKFGFTYAFEHFHDKVEWVLKADDDTYIIVENLMHLLAQKDPSTPLYIGSHLKVLLKQGYMSGGAGYVLSRKAVEMVVKAFPDPALCLSGEWGSEDLEMGTCLQNIGIAPQHAADNTGAEETFLPIPLMDMMFLKEGDWLFDDLVHKPKPGLACCSEQAISFHYASPGDILQLEFLIYKLKIAGVHVSMDEDQASPTSSSSTRNSQLQLGNNITSIELGEQNTEVSPLQLENSTKEPNETEVQDTFRKESQQNLLSQNENQNQVRRKKVLRKHVKANGKQRKMKNRGPAKG